MKRFKRRMSPVALIATLVFVGCFYNGCASLGLVDDTPSYLATQYKALAVAQETYNTIWGGFKSAYDAKLKDDDGGPLIDQETYDKGFELATAYYEAWQIWMDAVMQYEVGATGEEETEEKAEALKEVGIKFVNFLTPYMAD